MKHKIAAKNLFVPKNNYELFGQQLYNLLVENFSQTFFVGGMVRNLLWHKKVTDIDIATSATPTKLIKLLTKANYGLDLSAQRYGVINVLHHKDSIQITTFRSEQYLNNRYPKIEFTKSVAKDAQRRDFTINSLYFNAKTNTIIDPADGLIHIKLKRLMTIGDPVKKFQEDPLRIVRAYRFQKQFNLQIEARTQKALNNSLLLIKKLSKSKLNAEIKKANSTRVQNYLHKIFS
jgi:tRNA nucleotidyltransferase (CCA-adding enzyme)